MLAGIKAIDLLLKSRKGRKVGPEDLAKLHEARATLVKHAESPPQSDADRLFFRLALERAHDLRRDREKMSSAWSGHPRAIPDALDKLLLDPRYQDFSFRGANRSSAESDEG